MPRFAIRRPVDASEMALLGLMQALINPLREQLGMPLLSEAELVDLFRALMRQAKTPDGP